MIYFQFLLHMPALFMTSQTQTAKHENGGAHSRAFGTFKRHFVVVVVVAFCFVFFNKVDRRSTGKLLWVHFYPFAIDRACTIFSLWGSFKGEIVMCKTTFSDPTAPRVISLSFASWGRTWMTDKTRSFLFYFILILIFSSFFKYFCCCCKKTGIYMQCSGCPNTLTTSCLLNRIASSRLLMS